MRSVNGAIGFALALACLFACHGSAAAAARASAEQQIESLEVQLRDASLKRDAAFFERSLADDFVHTGPSGEQIAKAEYVADVASGALNYQVLERGDVKIRVFGDVAVVSERDLMKGSFRNHYFSGRYRIMRVWTRQKGRWVVATSQATFFVERAGADDEPGSENN